MPGGYGFLEELLEGDQISRGESDLGLHAGDAGVDRSEGAFPDVVVWPESTGEVSAVLAAANERGIPVTPYAAGTGLEGNAIPVRGGISMDCTRMDAVLDVRPGDLQVDVQPGAIGAEINDALESHGLFFPPLPASGDISTIGGMIATDASGMLTVKYGEVHDWLLELEVVLADGTVTTVGSKARKTSSGYNLMDLIVGSEGTLAVVTRATLEVAGLPRQIRGGYATFPDYEAAAGAVADAIGSGVDVAKIEFLDGLLARAIEDHWDLGLPRSPLLLLEFHANHDVDHEIDFCRTVFESHGLDRFELLPEERMDPIWEARENLAEAYHAAYPELRSNQAGDVTVPISRYPDFLTYAKDLSDEHGVPIACFGHAGDGNVHYSVLVDRNDEDAIALGDRLYGDLVEKAIELGGTATGEHGVGLGKRTYLRNEHGRRSIELMRQIKDVFDPNGILNPGKIFPEDGAEDRPNSTES